MGICPAVIRPNTDISEFEITVCKKSNKGKVKAKIKAKRPKNSPRTPNVIRKIKGKKVAFISGS